MKWSCSDVGCTKWFKGECPSYATASTSKTKCKTNPQEIEKKDNLKAI